MILRYNYNVGVMACSIYRIKPSYLVQYARGFVLQAKPVGLEFKASEHSSYKLLRVGSKSKADKNVTNLPHVLALSCNSKVISNGKPAWRLQEKLLLEPTEVS